MYTALFILRHTFSKCFIPVTIITYVLVKPEKF